MNALTIVHVIISLIGIGTGFVVIYGFLTARRLDVWTAIFLTTTILTSATGFLFPFDNGFTPGHAIGILSLLLLGVALWARYRMQMAGAWRVVFVVMAMIAQYFNVFVLIVQTFKHTPALQELQGEPPFQITQLVVLALFVALTIGSAIRFRGVSLRADLV